MKRKRTADQMRRAAISNMNLKTRLMQAKTKKRTVKGHVFNYARTVKAKRQPLKAARKKKHIIRLPAVVLERLGFPANYWD